MGKTLVRMKAVVYALSPFQKKVMPGLWKDITTKIHHKVSENWISATLLLIPIVGTYKQSKKKAYLLIDYSNNLQISVYVLGAIFLQLYQILLLEKHPMIQKLIDPSLFNHHFT